MMKNTTTLRQAIETLYSANPQMSVKEILGSVQGSFPEVDYRKVYNTLKRVQGVSYKSSKSSKTEKSSIIFDLTAPPAGSVKGIVFRRGQHCK